MIARTPTSSLIRERSIRKTCGPLVLVALIGACALLPASFWSSAANGQNPGDTKGNTPTLIEQYMSAADFKKCGLAKLSKSELAELDAWFLRTTAALVAQMGEQAGKSMDFKDLIGATIVADDGTFLGLISTSTVDSKSILNSVGKHGSEVARESIFNQVGRYGGAVALMSPFNEVCIRPPKIFKGDKFIAYLTVNKVKSPRIDPHALVGWLKSQ